MKIPKDKKNECYKIVKRVADLIKSCDKDYDKLIFAMGEIYTKLTDGKSPRLEEFSKTYIISEIAESPTIKLRKQKMKRAFEINNNFTIFPEIYFYEKAPHGMIIGIAIYDFKYDKTCPIKIDLFINEN